MLPDEFIVVQVRIRAMDAVNLLGLARRERLVWIEAPSVFQQALPTEHFVDARDAAGEAIRGVEEGGVAVGHLRRKREQRRGNGLARAASFAFTEEFN